VSRLDRIIVAIVGGAVVLAAAAGYVLLAPSGSPVAPIDPSADPLLAVAPAVAESPAPASTIVVDVGGAVVQPGVHELPAGARIADAIDAAGGFGPDADLEATAELNLAQPLVDGQQIRVPRIGDGVATVPFGSAPASGSGGLVDINTATPEELEALPGIGAVTVQKIVAARQEQPFTSLQDMVDRGIIHRGQLEDITDLATAG